MKKSFILLPALMMVLTACGGTTSDDPTTTTEPGTTTTTTEPGSTTTDPVEENNVKVAYEAAAALANKTESADAYDFDGVVIAKCGNSFFVYKDGYSMYVYSSSAHEGVEVGKTVAVNAKVKKYNGIIETGTVNSVTVTGEGVVPTATTITSAAELGALKQNVLVNYEAAIPADAGDYSAGNSPLVSTVVGKDTITTKFDKAGYNDDNGAAYLASKGHKANFTNVIATAFSTSGDTATNQLLFVGTSTLALVEVPATAVTLTADKEEATVGETVTLTPTVTPAETTDAVKYEITAGADLATLNGNVLTTTGAGTVTVVAKAGTVTSNPVTITISAPTDNAVSIAVTPTELTKKAGETLTAAELTVEVTRASGAKEVTNAYTTDVTLPYTFTDADATAGTKTITVSYPGVADVTVTVTVNAKDRSIKTAYEAILANSADTTAYEFDGVVVGKTKNNFIVMDEAGYGIYAYNNTAYDFVTVGQMVRVVSTLQLFNGWVETKTITSVTNLEKTGTVPTAFNLANQSQLATLKQNTLVNVTIDLPADASWTSGGHYMASATVGDGTFTIKFDKAAYTAEMGEIFNSAKGGKLKINGALAMTYDKSGSTAVNQLLVLGTTTLEKVVVPATGITLAADVTSVEVGGSVTLTPTVTPVDSTDEVTYEVTTGADLVTLSGNSLVAKAEGTVTVVAKAGTVTSDPVTITITASADPVVSFAVTGPTTKKVGATLTAEELTVTLTKQSGATEVTDVFTTDVELPYTFTAEDAIAGTKAISVTYAELSAQTVSIAVVDAVYKLDASVKGTNSSYAGNGDVAVNDVTWNVAGNATTNPWRIGGKSITNTDRAIYSKTAIAAANEIDINGLTDSGSITVNSMKVTVHSTADDAATGANAVAEFTPTYAKGSIVLTKADAGSWENCFYRIVFNVTVSVKSNKYVSFTDIQFYNL